ncbi:hypothetical protein FK530_09265 [Tsukamurella conjunctivitidis]|uniref:Uncharacterized protein n=1 Tax=Tsukamurella conjunctivitidis TaxID=2592068 RepID=A0A5C5S309_9ACTN|nr:hypothetical protein [Tsukamurella conjunctivitidis]TWS29003.1 hypothetical protein FK530_09265 [Tsukamurella conjunctivitidis]
MSNSDVTREDVADLISELRSTITRAAAAGRPDIVQRAKDQIERQIGSLAALGAADAQLADAKEALAAAEQALRDLL